MAYAIGTLSGIPPVLRAALARAGIADTDALLTAARVPNSRDALAAELAVDAVELDTWASVADLLRVTVLTPPVAERSCGPGSRGTCRNSRKHSAERPKRI
jgi:hypothetical protein